MGTVDLSTSQSRLNYTNYVYSSPDGLYGRSQCVSAQIALLNSYPNGIYSGNTCSGATFNTSKAGVLAFIDTDWSNTIIPNMIGQDYFDYFDRNKGFNPATQVYRASPAASDAHDTLTVASIRNNLYLRDITQNWIEYLIPSKLTTGCTYRFSVSIRKGYNTVGNKLVSMDMSIANHGSNLSGCL